MSKFKRAVAISVIDGTYMLGEIHRYSKEDKLFSLIRVSRRSGNLVLHKERIPSLEQKRDKYPLGGKNCA